MLRNLLQDKFICLVDLNIKNTFVIQTLSLNHLTVMDANNQQAYVH